MLVTEEMRWVIFFLDWKKVWWSSQAQARTGTPQDIRSGLAAYAAKQEHLMQSLAMHFAAIWYPVLCKNSIDIAWPHLYIPANSLPASVEYADADADHSDSEMYDVDALM